MNTSYKREGKRVSCLKAGISRGKHLYRRILHKTVFDQYTEQFTKFLRTIPTDAVIQDNNIRWGILVCPWLNTPLPWFAITLAILLHRICQRRVSIIVNDLWLKYGYCEPNQQGSHNIKQAKIIRNVCKRYKVISQNVDIIFLSEIDIQDVELDNEEHEIIKHIAEINVLRQHHNSFDYTYQMNIEQDLNNWIRVLTAFYPYVKKVISSGEWEKFIVGGGIYAESGIFTEELQRQHVKMITYDSGYHTVCIGLDGYAGRYINIGEAVERINDKGLKKKICIKRF